MIAPTASRPADILYGIYNAFIFFVLYSVVDWFNWRAAVAGGGGLLVLLITTPFIKEGFTEAELLFNLRRQIRWSLIFLSTVALISYIV